MDQSKTVKLRVVQFSPYSSPIPLVFAAQVSYFSSISVSVHVLTAKVSELRGQWGALAPAMLTTNRGVKVSFRSRNNLQSLSAKSSPEEPKMHLNFWRSGLRSGLQCSGAYIVPPESLSDGEGDSQEPYPGSALWTSSFSPSGLTSPLQC